MSSQYYAIGNTAGYNVAAGVPAEVQHIKVLLAGCGDIRNLLATVAGLHAKQLADCSSSNIPTQQTLPEVQQQQQRLSFVLNDGNVSMLARDAVMLHMIAEQQAPPDAVLAVWANHTLTTEQHALLLNSCRALAEQPWPAWLTAASTFEPCLFDRAPVLQQQEPKQGADSASSSPADQSSRPSGISSTGSGSAACDAELAVRAACAAWCSCTLSLKQLLEERDSRTTSPKERLFAVDLSLRAAAATASANSSSSKVGKKLQKEITEYIQTGSLQQGPGSKAQQNQPNLTFLKAPELQYALYFSSSIFRAVALPDGAAAAAATAAGAAELLLAAVGPQIVAAAEALQQGLLSVVLVPGDILTVATQAPSPKAGSRAAPNTDSTSAAGGAAGAGALGAGAGVEECDGVTFDYIDTSNVSDYT